MRLRRFVVALLAVVAALGILTGFFFFRPPVLIITDAPFVLVYGVPRIKLQQVSASQALFRPVKPVPIADGVSPDMVLFSIGEASARPFCVVFPARFVDSALRYRQQFPETPTLLMENKGSVNRETAAAAGVFVFTTDTEADLYRAGRCAAVLTGEKPGEILLFHEPGPQRAGREAFSRGLADEENSNASRFLSNFSQLEENTELSCVVLAGSGAEFLDKNTKTPVILFSWLNPALVSQEIAVIFDDSPWALAVPAIRMAVQQQSGGQIPSKVLIFSARVADNGILQKLKKAAGALPETERDAL